MKKLKADIEKEKWFKESLSVVVFGASGDLAKKKTYPALFDLFLEGLLGKHTIICGYARSEKSDDEIRQQVRPFLEKASSDAKKIDEFLRLCIYREGEYNSARSLRTACENLTKLHGSPKGAVENRVFYLALPPTSFTDAVKAIKEGGVPPNGFTRIIIEKPFGQDTASARALSSALGAIFPETNLYRIDHYLGKELVQNIMSLRFANSMFEPIWNRNHIQGVMITFKEDFGTMGRGGYFDKSGIIRDIMQNHLMQVLCLVAMEPPKGKGNEAIRDEKVKVLQAMKPWEMKNTVLGQYTRNGSEPGYLEDETVPKDSKCPTFACTVMYIDNPRWRGVPFIMRAGKALDERLAEVRVQMKTPAGADQLFALDNPLPNNELVIRIQPDEAIFMTTNFKTPGLTNSLLQTELDVTYSKRFPKQKPVEAYTRLLLDVFRGNQAPFVRNDELIAAWEIATPLLQEIEKRKIPPTPYKFGSRSLKEADDLISGHGYVLPFRNSEDEKENRN